MNLPVIKRKNMYKRSTLSFGGINLTQNYSSGELRNCTGISHNAFPSITQRDKSEMVFECLSPTAAIFENIECVATDDGLYYDRKKVGALSSGRKMLASLGKKIIVFPDKVCYDTESGELSDLSGRCTTYGNTVTFTNNSISVGNELFVEKMEGDFTLFHDGVGLITYESVKVEEGNVILEGFALKKISEITTGTLLGEKCNDNQYRIVQNISYSADSGVYEVANDLITVTNVLEDVFATLSEGDVVEISGCDTLPQNNISSKIISKNGNTLIFADGTFSEGTEECEIFIQRKIPDFNCICSYENRLWGCEGNTVYASALGDASNFFVYNNLSTDSYTVSSNSAGDFTACISYGNSCLFFKENSCYKLYGNRPSNFQLSESFGGGIRREDARSLVNAGGKVFFKGNGGVYAFYGGIPQCISDKLGNLTMENCVAGSEGKLYYLSADTENGREEFVWDIEKSLWSKSGVTDTLGYVSHGGHMYRLKNDGIERICREADKEAQWSMTLCPFDEGYYKTKNYTRLYIRAQLFEGAYIRTEIKRDNEPWEIVDTSYGEEKKYLNIPCVVKSCHEVQLRLSGKGKSIIEAIVREFSVN